MTALRFERLALTALVAALLGACASGGGGGGGGGVTPVSPPPPPPPPVSFPPLAPPHANNDFPNLAGTEFAANWGPGGINAQVAWQNGATGAGVLVGVIDDGIDPNHPELSGRISPNSTDIVAGRNALTTTLSHGSEISSLIVGNYNNAQTVGVAYDATVLAVRADDGSGSFSSTNLAAAIDYARLQGVSVINLSLGSVNPTAQVTRDAIQRATQAGIIIVVSAGNDGNQGATQPNYPGLLAIDPVISNGLIIVAGGLNRNGTVNTASNPPGTAANFYMTAPGWEIIVPDHGPAGPVVGFQTCGLGANGDLCRIQGTSYASPHIAGAIALVKDAFPSLTPAQIVDLLYTTADDTGAAGTDGVNGRGRLNVGRAFQPVGPLMSPLIMATAAPISADSLIGVVGAPFGNGLTRHTAAWNVAAFDNYSRTFNTDLSDNWVTAQAGPTLEAHAPPLWRQRTIGPVSLQLALAEDVAPESYRLPVDRNDLQQPSTRIDADLGNGFSFSFAANGAQTNYRPAENSGHMSFVNADTSMRLTRAMSPNFSLSLLVESGEAVSGLDNRSSERSAMALQASFNAGGHSFGATFGHTGEDNALLGSSWTSALGETPNGETNFFTADWSHMTSWDWRVSAAGEVGFSGTQGAGWLSVTEPLQTTSFTLAADRNVTPEWFEQLGLSGVSTLRLSLSQSIRVEAGTLSYQAPTATKYGLRSLSYETRTIDPTPDGRELRLGARYSYFDGQDASAFGEVVQIVSPGHVADAEPETLLRVGIRVAR